MKILRFLVNYDQEPEEFNFILFRLRPLTEAHLVADSKESIFYNIKLLLRPLCSLDNIIRDL